MILLTCNFFNMSLLTLQFGVSFIEILNIRKARAQATLLPIAPGVQAAAWVPRTGAHHILQLWRAAGSAATAEAAAMVIAARHHLLISSEITLAFRDLAVILPLAAR